MTVIGYSEEAVTDALFLADIAREVLLINHERESSEVLKRRLVEKGNIRIVNGEVTAILGQEVVKAVKISNTETGKEVQEEVNGVFISLGNVPMTQIVKKQG